VESAAAQLNTLILPPAGVGKAPRHVRRIVRLLLIALSLSAILALVITFSGFSAQFGVKPVSPQRLIPIVIGNLLVLLTLTFFIVRRAYGFWQAARAGLVGTRLQTRIILTFATVTLVPTLIVTLFSALFFNFGVKAWFDNRVSVALEESVTLAEAYLNEHRSAMHSEARGISSDLAPDLALIDINPPLFDKALNMQAAQRNLSEAIVFTPSRVVARTALSFSLTFERLPDVVIERANEGNIVILGNEEDDKIRAVIKLAGANNLYLLIGKTVDRAVISHMQMARTTMEQYHYLQRDMRSIQRQFTLAFILLALLLLLASIWAGMAVALRVIGPVSLLVAAAERVRSGDYDIRVPEGRADDEIATLGRSFNRMTSQLSRQRADLIDANRLLNERRRLTEAVFAGVSAGVISLTPDKRITLYNRSALKLLGIAAEDSLKDRAIIEVMPAIAELLNDAQQAPEKISARDIVITRGETRATLHVRITLERAGEVIEGYVVTFDDITDLVTAQRSAAWADVARRIAHEIKNPLTPITLSSERLRKKFADEITSDKDAYLRYIDTITRHVRDIGKMVEEFVSFARMPQPQMRKESLISIINKSIFSEATAHSDIRYITEVPSSDIRILCDEQQIGQMLLNLLKNAAEAMEGQTAPLKITVCVEQIDQHIHVSVRDSGAGFPPEQMATLTEPYVTTRAKGTGLGLAIVKKTMEDHKGRIQLANHPEGGAMVTLIFPALGA
jgi:two-component system nitrogen regulation sensor histidine kinase NtrY